MIKKAIAGPLLADQATIGTQVVNEILNVRQQQEAAELDAWFRRQVQIGVDSADAGKLVPAAEVEAKFATRRSRRSKLNR